VAGSPVDYPSIKVGGKAYQLRFAHSAWFMLQQWGYRIGDPNKPIPMAALAAAAAGEVDAAGRWHSAGFARPVDMLDQMQDGETLGSFDEPVLAALKKAAPKAEVSTVAAPPVEADGQPVN